MYASVLRSKTISPAEPRRQRADGRVAITVAGGSFATRAVRVAESGSLRVRMPRVPGPTLEAVLINTAGGIVCGDRFAIDVDASPGAQVTLATPAAERVYRSDGATADLAVRLKLGAGAGLAWLPQETILFDRARVRRRIEAELPGDASLLLFEAVVFGREARGEEVSEGFFEDRWRIRRAGRLVYADTLRLEGPIAGLLARPAIAAGARALATFLYVAPDAESRLDEARTVLKDCFSLTGASAWNGLLAARFLARSGAELRRDAIAFLKGFRGGGLPRVWHC
jgi:urease accessory protein